MSCLRCGVIINPYEGRSDRKFCSIACKQSNCRSRLRVSKRPIQSLVRGDNTDLIREVAKLYASDPDIGIADVTFGKGNFWKKTPHLNVVGSDLITVQERPYNFRNLPYADKNFNIVVLGPPYLAEAGDQLTDRLYRNGQTTKGLHYRDIRKLYRDGLMEGHQIARPQIWVKYKVQVSGRVQRSLHLHVFQDAKALGMVGRDFFILDPTGKVPTTMWTVEHHARKLMAYLWVFDCRD